MSECIDHGQKDRYGSTKVAGRCVKLHRAVYCTARGLTLADIAGQVVRHTCDNCRCINPDHLELGTQRDNLLDRVRTGGQRRLSTRQLTDDEVRYIRRAAVPRRNFGKLATELGVTRNTIRNVYRRAHYAEVSD